MVGRRIVFIACFKFHSLINKLWFHAQSSSPRVFVFRYRWGASLVIDSNWWQLILIKLIHVREDFGWHDVSEEPRRLLHCLIDLLYEDPTHIDYVNSLKYIPSITQWHVLNRCRSNSRFCGCLKSGSLCFLGYRQILNLGELLCDYFKLLQPICDPLELSLVFFLHILKNLGRIKLKTCLYVQVLREAAQNQCLLLLL